MSTDYIFFLPPPPESQQLDCWYSTFCYMGCMLVISVSVFAFPREFSLSYIRLVIVPMVLVPPMVLRRVDDIPVSQWSIHFFVSC